MAALAVRKKQHGWVQRQCRDLFAMTISFSPWVGRVLSSKTRPPLWGFVMGVGSDGELMLGTFGNPVGVRGAGEWCIAVRRLGPEQGAGRER